ncbi:MAG: hypothetical protein ACE5E2_04925, partial [Candidatus Binatia bacterium]
KSSQGPLGGTWYGDYGDTGGKGRITLVLVQRGTEIQGIWKVQGGVRGSLEGKVDGDRATFVLLSSSEKCPGRGKGSAKIEGDRLSGKYSGQDCRGKTNDGKFEVRR